MFAFNSTDTPDQRAGKAFFNLRWTLWLNRSELTTIFDSMSNLNGTLKNLVTKSYDANAAWTTVGDINMGPGSAFAAVLQAADEGRGAYAGLIFVLLRTITKRFRDEFQPQQQAWDSLPKPLYGYTIFQIIRAASNDFRHYDDWRRANPLTDEQKRDIRVLAGAWNRFAADCRSELESCFRKQHVLAYLA